MKKISKNFEDIIWGRKERGEKNNDNKNNFSQKNKRSKEGRKKRTGGERSLSSNLWIISSQRTFKWDIDDLYQERPEDLSQDATGHWESQGNCIIKIKILSSQFYIPYNIFKDWRVLSRDSLERSYNIYEKKITNTTSNSQSN